MTPSTRNEQDLARQLRVTLSPFFEMLDAKKDRGSKEEWTQLVRTLRAAIIRAPDQYVKVENPDRAVLRKAIKSVFDEMLGQVDYGEPSE